MTKRKEPTGGAAFDKLARALVQVPRRELERQIQRAKKAKRQKRKRTQ